MYFYDLNITQNYIKALNCVPLCTKNYIEVSFKLFVESSGPHTSPEIRLTASRLQTKLAIT